MLDELAMVFQVARRPNAAFAALRDDDHRYFQPSIVLMLLGSLAYVGLGLAAPEPAGQPTMDVATRFGLAVLGNAAGAGTIYLLGRALGGNKSWRKVLTVIFYMNIVLVPLAALQAVSYPQSLSLQAIVSIASLAAFAWAVILSVKAVKVLNGFGTAKAVGILVLSIMIQLAWIIPITLLYVWPILADLGITLIPP